MSDDAQVSLKDFGASFKNFLDQVAAQHSAQDPPFVRLFTEHFRTDPRALPVVAEVFEMANHPNIQLAIESLLTNREHRLVGVVGEDFYRGVSFTQLLAPSQHGSPPREGSVEYVNVPVGDDKVLACVQRGIFLVSDQSWPIAVLMRGPDDIGFRERVRVEVMSTSKEAGEQFLRDLRNLMRKRNVYRGKIISLGLNQNHSVVVSFHRLQEISRDRIILPEGLLERIERQTIHFARYAEKLRSAGRHIKRGLLLYGPPGTGKTFTAMYLVRQMTDRTVLLITGRGIGLIEQSCGMARMLQPATVILEDVDLVAEERTRPNQTCRTVLFELLNEMDGLADDADILFVLTTNRADILEPALAARPGRIDQAFEIPLPDANSRRKLIALYGAGLNLQLTQLDDLVRRTEGVSAAFIRELLRRAALLAADDGQETISVSDAHVDEAIHELLVSGGELTKSLLGARPAQPN